MLTCPFSITVIREFHLAGRPCAVRFSRLDLINAIQLSSSMIHNYSALSGCAKSTHQLPKAACRTLARAKGGGPPPPRILQVWKGKRQHIRGCLLCWRGSPPWSLLSPSSEARQEREVEDALGQRRNVPQQGQPVAAHRLLLLHATTAHTQKGGTGQLWSSGQSRFRKFTRETRGMFREPRLGCGTLRYSFESPDCEAKIVIEAIKASYLNMID